MPGLVLRFWQVPSSLRARLSVRVWEPVCLEEVFYSVTTVFPSHPSSEAVDDTLQESLLCTVPFWSDTFFVKQFTLMHHLLYLILPHQHSLPGQAQSPFPPPWTTTAFYHPCTRYRKPNGTGETSPGMAPSLRIWFHVVCVQCDWSASGHVFS